MSILRVANWQKYQQDHKDGRRFSWLKLHVSILNDYEFSKLPDAQKSHLMLIWCVAMEMGNEIPDDARWIERKIQAQEPVDVDALVRAGWLQRSGDDADLTLHQNGDDADLMLHQNGDDADLTLHQNGDDAGDDADLMLPRVRVRERIRIKHMLKSGVDEPQIDAPFDQAQPDRVGQPDSKQHQDDDLKEDHRRAFDDFWAVYPRKVGKKAARHSWGKLLPDVRKGKLDTAVIIRAVEAQRKAPPWKEHLAQKDLKYITHPATWLNGRRWEDELPGAPDADWAKRQMCDYLGYWDQDLIQPLLDAVKRRGEDARLLLDCCRDKSQILADLEAC